MLLQHIWRQKQTGLSQPNQNCKWRKRIKGNHFLFGLIKRESYRFLLYCCRVLKGSCQIVCQYSTSGLETILTLSYAPVTPSCLRTSLPLNMLWGRRQRNQREIVANHQLWDLQAPTWTAGGRSCQLGHLHDAPWQAAGGSRAPAIFLPITAYLITVTDVTTDLLCLSEHQGLNEGWVNTNQHSSEHGICFLNIF